MDKLHMIQKQVDALWNTQYKEIMKKIPVNKIVIYNRQNIKRNDEKRWILRFEKFRAYPAGSNTEIFNSIPIIMSYNNHDKYPKNIQYLFIWKTGNDEGDVGISVKYDSDQNSISITGFHIDLQAIKEQHYLAMGYSHNQSCKCLDSFHDNTIITHLTIGDPNQHEIDIERLKQQLRKKNEEIASLKMMLKIPLINPSSPSSTANTLMDSVSNNSRCSSQPPSPSYSRSSASKTGGFTMNKNTNNDNSPSNFTNVINAHCNNQPISAMSNIYGDYNGNYAMSMTSQPPSPSFYQQCFNSPKSSQCNCNDEQPQ